MEQITTGKKIVAIGGGTGTFTLVKGLHDYTNFTIASVVTMADDGGSNKVLRDEFGLLPTSGIRQSIVALAQDEGLLRKLFEYRYYQGIGISGMTFGNLFMAALADILGSQKQAIKETGKLLGIRGRVLPVSYENTSLVATYTDGTEVLGEHYIDLSSPKVSHQRITSLRTIPKIMIDSDAKEAISQADYIIFGPGDLYTNTIANLVVDGVRDAVQESHAHIIFVMNLMSRAGETYNYTARDHMDDLSQYLDPKRINTILVNNDLTLSKETQEAYSAEGSMLVHDDLGEKWHSARIIRTALRSHYTPEKVKGDVLARSIVRHDQRLLAEAIREIAG